MNILYEIESRFQSDVISDSPTNRYQDFPQWMRRCFMTGKQCIFCPQDTVFDGHSGPKERDSVFMIMPFRPHLDAFFYWSLKPYLSSFGIEDSNIRRADHFANTGYVMCEKICLRIQQAALVVVDMSLRNPNVYYELGLAVGLNKPLLVMCDEDRERDYEPGEWRAIGLQANDVVKYPNVGLYEAKEHPLERGVTKVSLEPRKAEMNILALLVRDSGKSLNERVKQDNTDIDVGFDKAIEAAVGVAVSRLPLEDPVGSKSLKKCHVRFLTEEGGGPSPYLDIVRHINTALVCIVDLAGENPLSYFWLGYCHARNINVIPIYREQATKPNGSDGIGKVLSSHVLAFDIRALWYIQHDLMKTKDLAGKLQAALEPILVRDVAIQERRAFWERLTRGGRVHIYNGAVHHGEINREVVGDWDLRTASELVRYLSSTEESVVPVLESPVYSPETIAEKLDTDFNEEYLSEYLEQVREELKEKSCLIVASADVNPLTEILLAYAYEKGEANGTPICFQRYDDDTAAVVALKGGETSKMSTDSNKCDIGDLARRFYRSTESPGRGFSIDGAEHTLPYYSQDEAVEPFSILAQLVILRNPFSEARDNVIVILNGVSGPATLGAAEVLTGGTTREKNAASELILKAVNSAWESSLEKEQTPRRYNGVEALIEVDVVPPVFAQDEAGKEGEIVNIKQKVSGKFYDKRIVNKWLLYKPNPPLKSIRVGNPRPFPS